MKYEDVLKRFVSTQAQLLQEKQMRQQQREQMLAEKAQGLQSFVPGMQGHSPEEEYTESEHNPFEESQEYEDGGIHIDPSKKGTFKAQATRMGMSVQEAASHILNNKEDYTPTMVKKANFAKNFAKEEGGEMYGDPPKKNPYRTQVRASNNLNLANGNTNFNSSSMLIDDYDDGTPSDTSYMYNTPTENVFFSTAVNPETKQKFGQRQSNDKFSQLTPEERKYYQAKIMQELQRKESGGMFTGDYEYPDGGEFDKPRFSVGLYASPEMGSSVSPSLNFQKGNFNANVSTNIPIEMPNRYNRNLNVDANYNTGKFGNIGVSGSAYRNEEGMPAYNAGLRYEVPINDKLNFMLNANTSSFENLRDNANVSAGLRYTFEEGGDITKTVKSKDGTITNIKQNADGSKTVQVRTKDGKYSEKVIPNNKYISPLTGKPYVPMQGNATIPSGWEAEDNTLEDIAEFIDPTGMLSWDDVARAYDENGLFDPKTGLEILGALPLIGKIGKSGKILAGGEKLFLDAVKYFGYNDKIANAYKAYTKMGGKNLDKVLGLTTKGLTKLSPKLNPEKWESSMKLINGLNKFTEGAKATKLLPYSPSGDTQTKNDEDYAEGGSFNNPGFNALPEAVQDKIIAAMMYGGSFNNNNWD